jgi:hypothetical protein
MTALYIILAAVAYVVFCLFVYSLMRVSSDADDRAEREYADFMANRRTCPTCAHHLGGGQCRQNLESECAEGEFEAWQAKSN